jgi:gliding motility-associated-like protein
MVESANGCKDETSFEHRVNGNITFYIPNAFSPNNDGVNDDFGLEPKEFVNEIDFKLFNRWGNLVEQSTDIDNLITSDLMPGLYMYTIDIIDFNGKKQYYYGTVNVW